jgi:BASS family bile acid:Na+ symporter
MELISFIIPGQIPSMPPEEEKGSSVLKKVGKAALYFVAFAVAIPLMLGWIFGIPAGDILILVGSAILLQAAAPPVGLGLGMEPPAIVIIMAFFALGMVLAIREACESLAVSSEKVQKWVDNMGKKTEQYPQIQKYGPVSCILIAWIPGIGLYGTPIISWILSWKRITSAFFTVLGFVIASIFVLFFMSKLVIFQEIFILAGMIGVVVFAIATMFSMIFTFTIPQIRALLKDRRTAVLSLVAGFLLVPLVAWLIARFGGLSSGFAAGLLIAASAAGATFLLKFTKGAQGNQDLVGGLMVFPTVLTVAFMPLVLPVLDPSAFPDPARIAMTLVLLIFIPLVLALLARSRSEAATTAWAPLATKISGAGLVAVFVGFLGAVVVGLFIEDNQLAPGILGTRAILAALALLLLAFGIGYLVGGPGLPERRVLGMATGMRNLAAASVVATFCFLKPYTGRLLPFAPDMEIVNMVVIIGLAGIILFTYLGKRLAKQAA